MDRHNRGQKRLRPWRGIFSIERGPDILSDSSVYDKPLRATLAPTECIAEECESSSCRHAAQAGEQCIRMRKVKKMSTRFGAGGNNVCRFM